MATVRGGCLGKKPVTPAELERAVVTFRELTAGQEVQYEGQPTRLTWATGSPPVWIAGYGPKVLSLAGRIADGVILQFADPDLIAWCLGFVWQGAKEAGRDPKSIEIMAAAPVWVSDDLALARQRVRWFPALVSNHVVDLISRYKPEDLPASLTSYVQNRAGYDYQHHAEVGSDNASFVSDEVVDRFCLVGPVEAHRQKLQKLADVGVTQFNIYLMCGDEEQTLENYKREVLPGFLLELDLKSGWSSRRINQFLFLSCPDSRLRQVTCAVGCEHTLDSKSTQIEATSVKTARSPAWFRFLVPSTTDLIFIILLVAMSGGALSSSPVGRCQHRMAYSQWRTDAAAPTRSPGPTLSPSPWAGRPGMRGSGCTTW